MDWLSECAICDLPRREVEEELGTEGGITYCLPEDKGIVPLSLIQNLPPEWLEEEGGKVEVWICSKHLE